MRDYSFGYKDKTIVSNKKVKKIFPFIIAILIIAIVWFGLNQKLLFGGDWISQTYDNDAWKSNEGNLHTYGAWDLETHVWKSQYILDNYPNFNWNPYWYMGTPLLKYYQSGFYILNIAFKLLTGLTMARSALLIIIFAHLLATLMTFLLCYKVSKKPILSALLSLFILSINFMSLRSYGWEPITVVFLFFYPLGLLIFLKEPTKPLRFSLIITLALSYLLHPLIFFSLCMTFGLYLLSIAINEKDLSKKNNRPYLLNYFILVFISLLLSAVQFLPQLSYNQVTSGAHMGVKYIPFYHVEFNILPLYQFLFDAGNLDGPGFIILVAAVILLSFWLIERNLKRKNKSLFNKWRENKKTLMSNDLVRGFAFVLAIMVLFYYFERFNIFPMNIFRSVQYHRIIPEFVIAASVLVAAISNTLNTEKKKIFYYATIIAFVIASLFIVYTVQEKWQTTNTISDSPEFLNKTFEGRITFPYTDQSLAVRNSFTKIPQVYGYYEQGITNSYADELFSVSSGFQSVENTLLYLKAADVSRIYINMEEGPRDKIMLEKLNGTLDFFYNESERYGYFEIPLNNPSFGQAVNLNDSLEVKKYEPGCRVLFQEKYCGSEKEEFVSSDLEEIRYLKKYVNLIEKNNSANVNYVMVDPQHYNLKVSNATKNTAVIVKMDYDEDFKATINGEEIPIETIGPEFMLLMPNKSGNYTINLTYHVSKVVRLGEAISLISLIIFILVFIFKRNIKFNLFKLKEGDLNE